MSQGNLAKWHVKPGDEIKPGTILADVETDKAVLAFENQDEGFVARLLVADGARDIPVGKPVAVLVEESNSIDAFANFKEDDAIYAQATPSASTAISASAAPARQGTSAGYPPHTRMTMPALSPTMERGNIVSWKVAPGDAIRPGDVLAEIETDKATLAFENVSDEGYIARILVPAGSRDIAVGNPVAVVVEHAEDVPAFAEYSAERPTSAADVAAPAVAPAPAGVAAKQKLRTEVNRRLGPAARALLEAAGLAPEDVTPTGPNSIVTKSDVLAAIVAGAADRNASTARPPASAPSAPETSQSAAGAPPPAAKAAPEKQTPLTPAPAPQPARLQSVVDTPNSQIRRIIAKRLLDSKVNMPAMYLSAEVQLDALADLRAALAAKGTKVSVNDCVLRAVALALSDVPAANVSWDEAVGAVVPFGSVDISFAVSTDKGLITPIVKAADTKGLLALSREVRSLAVRARENKLKPEEFMGGSFTVSNLGMYGLSYFSAIINPPQAAILAIGGGQERVMLRGNDLAVTTAMTVTLSADARVYDGELTAAFMGAFQSHIEKPYDLVGST